MNLLLQDKMCIFYCMVLILSSIHFHWNFLIETIFASISVFLSIHKFFSCWIFIFHEQLFGYQIEKYVFEGKIKLNLNSILIKLMTALIFVWGILMTDFFLFCLPCQKSHDHDQISYTWMRKKKKLNWKLFAFEDVRGKISIWSVVEIPRQKPSWNFPNRAHNGLLTKYKPKDDKYLIEYKVNSVRPLLVCLKCWHKITKTNCSQRDECIIHWNAIIPILEIRE